MVISKIGFPLHLQGLMMMRMVDLIMIKISFQCFHDMPSPLWVVCHRMPLMPLEFRFGFTMCTKLAQVSQNPSLLMLAQTHLALMMHL
jgi:hypothetical protein